MNYLLNSKVIIGIILILVLTFVFGMLVNLKEAYAYTSEINQLLNWSTTSDGYIFIQNNIANRMTFQTGSDKFFILKTNGHYNAYNSNGDWLSESLYVNYGIIAVLDVTNDVYDMPLDLLNYLDIGEIYFYNISNTISVTNDLVMGNTLKIDHPNFTYSNTPFIDGIIIELYNNTDTLIEVVTPESGTDFTNLDIPTSGTYYVKIKDMNIGSDPYLITPQTGLTFHLPTLHFIPGQPYKILKDDFVRTVEFTAEQPSQVYIYEEYTNGTFNIKNISPDGSVGDLTETSIITFSDSDTSDIEDTYILILDGNHMSYSAFANQMLQTDFIAVDDIPYMPEGVAALWEEISITSPSTSISYDVLTELDTGVESLDTFYDQLIYQNTSTVPLKVKFDTTIETDADGIYQIKRLDENGNPYWVDEHQFSISDNYEYTVYPNHRLVINLWRGTVEFTYQMQYVDNDGTIQDYTLGTDFTISKDSSIFGDDPTATDGTGIINNTGSAVTYPDINQYDPTQAYNDPSTTDGIHYEKPYDGILGLPSPFEIYNDAKEILDSAFEYMQTFNVVYSQLPNPFPQLVGFIPVALIIMLVLKIVG